MLNSIGVEAPGSTFLFVDNLWIYLAENNQKVSTGTINRDISATLTDELDASHEEMQVNLYLYELADSDWTRALEFR